MADATGFDLRVTILGCGCSSGVPRLGGPDGRGDWGACDPNEPRNRRMRCSIMVEQKRRRDPWREDAITRVLVDTAPDLREQLLAAGVARVDGVLYSHDHADQVNGLDDLRVVANLQGRRIPVHMDAATADTLLVRYSYVFRQKPGSLYPPILDPQTDLEPGRHVAIAGPGGPLDAQALLQHHGPIDSLGFRFGPIAYSNDCVELPEDTLARLTGLDIWIVDALRYQPHRTHAHLDKALGWIDRLKPRRAVLTNLHPDMDYRTLDAQTPAHVTPAHDGLVLMAHNCARMSGPDAMNDAADPAGA